MAQDLFHQESFKKVSLESGYSLLQNYSVKHAHPRALFIDSVGVIWSLYYLWAHNWSYALGAVILGRLIAYLSVSEVNPQKMAKTTLGKIALLHLNPVNMVVQVVGLVILGYGVWEHSTLYALYGVSVILLGHVIGWNKVDERFE